MGKLVLNSPGGLAIGFPFGHEALQVLGSQSSERLDLYVQTKPQVIGGSRQIRASALSCESASTRRFNDCLDLISVHVTCLLTVPLLSRGLQSWPGATLTSKRSTPAL